MNILKKIIFSAIISLFLFTNTGFAAISLNVSPLVYEIEVDPGTIITKTAELYNNGDEAIHIFTGKSDFVQNGNDGTPKFIRKSEIVNFDQTLSTWITIDKSEFNIAPHSKQIINFNINIPTDATPGGHYGAVFFKNNNSETTNGNGLTLPINIDYGVLLLIKVSGEISTIVEIEEPKVIKGNSGGNHHVNKTKDKNLRDKCPLGDLTKSKYDGKCINSTKEILNELTGKEKNSQKEEDNENNLDKNNDGENDYDSLVKIKIPISNKGNTHVKPKGEITLIDENGNKLKGIGKEIIANDQGLIIGEKIVDYLPINDRGGNVLPNQKRDYISEWLGFPYKEMDETKGITVIKYKDPGEFYTEKNLGKNRLLMPWERVCERYNTKKIQALIDITYNDTEGNPVEFNSAKEFEIEYKEEYIGINPYFCIIVFPIFLLFFLWWLIAFLRKKKCINKDCRKRIKRKMKICPYCGTNQEEKVKKSKKKVVKSDKKIKTKVIKDDTKKKTKVKKNDKKKKIKVKKDDKKKTTKKKVSK